MVNLTKILEQLPNPTEKQAKWTGGTEKEIQIFIFDKYLYIKHYLPSMELSTW